MTVHEIIFNILLAPFWIGAFLMMLLFIGVNLMGLWYILMICVVNPIYHIFTGGKNLKIYEDFRDMPHEDDFF